MQKKFLALFLTLCLLTAMTTGCGGNSAPQSSPASEPSSVADAPSSQETPEPPAEEPEPEPEPEPVKTWFEEKGLVITPQGDFGFLTAAGSSEREILGTFMVQANVVITETTDGVEPGYKKVTAVFTQNNDGSLNIPGAVGSWSSSGAFDRYTGPLLLDYDPEDEEKAEFLHPHELDPEEKFITIVIGENSYDLSYSEDQLQSLPVAIKEYTVICPEDYDGIVFFTGYSDGQRQEEYSQFDLAAKLYTFDELISLDDGYYFFSLTNE